MDFWLPPPGQGSQEVSGCGAGEIAIGSEVQSMRNLTRLSLLCLLALAAQAGCARSLMTTASCKSSRPKRIDHRRPGVARPERHGDMECRWNADRHLPIPGKGSKAPRRRSLSANIRPASSKTKAIRRAGSFRFHPGKAGRDVDQLETGEREGSHLGKLACRRPQELNRCSNARAPPGISVARRDWVNRIAELNHRGNGVARRRDYDCLFWRRRCVSKAPGPSRRRKRGSFV